MIEAPPKLLAPSPSAEDRLARPRAFLEDVKKLKPGDLAALRRAAGETLADSRGVLWMYRLLQRHTNERYFETYFFTATLLALDKNALKASNFNETNVNLGASLAKLGQKFSQEAVERRVNVMLDSRFDSGEMGFRMPQMIKMLTAVDISIHWPQLLSDLLSWDHPEKYVQKRWAAHFFAPSGDANEPETDLPL